MCGIGRLISFYGHLVHGSQIWCDEYFIATPHLITISIDKVVYIRSIPVLEIGVALFDLKSTSIP